MDAPASLAGEDIRDAKMKLVSAMPPVRPEDVIIGQFTDSLDGSKKGYTSEPGVKEDSRTETWTEFVCYIDNDRWRGVPILFRAGKAIEEWDVSFEANMALVPPLF
jgi:glucose-6-phosphate 1-dehydrogenase